MEQVETTEVKTKALSPARLLVGWIALMPLAETEHDHVGARRNFAGRVLGSDLSCSR